MTFEFINEKEVFAKDNEKILGNILLGKQSQNVFRILRVFTDENHRGQGIAGMLMEYLIKIAREKNFILIPVCSFAVAYFARHKENADVLF